MPILNNPLAQFIITVIIGLLTVLAAILIPIYIYRKQKNRKEITWRVISNTLVLPILEVGEQVKTKLKILYDNKSVDDLRLVVLKISNTGNIPIEANDFENNSPINFDFGKEAEILNVEILNTIPVSFKPRVETAFKVSQGKANLEPLLLNSKDAIFFKILLIKFSGQINVSGRITGVGEILGIDQSLQRARRFRSRIVSFSILFGIIVSTSIVWILSEIGILPGYWVGILSAIFTTLGLIIVFITWFLPLFPFDADASNPR